MKFYRVSYPDTGFAFYTRKRDAERDVRECNKQARLERACSDCGYLDDEWFIQCPECGHVLHESEYGSYMAVEMDEIEIEPTKPGLLRALSVYASHADNG